MPQLQLPIFPRGVTVLTNNLSFELRDGQVTYFNGLLPVFTHNQTDIQTFRLFTSQFIVNGVLTQAQVSKSFGIPLVTVKRYVKLFRTKGAKAFYSEPARRGAVVLTEETLLRAQGFFDEGFSRSDVGKRLGVKPNTLSKAILAGRLHEVKKKP
jgi:transposase